MARMLVSSTRKAGGTKGSGTTMKAAITSAMARARSFIAMNDRRSEGRDAYGDVLRPLRARRRILDPLSRVRDDGLPGIDVERAARGRNAQRTAQDDCVFVELRALSRLDPPAGADHAGYAQSRGTAVDPADVLLDALRLIACRFNDLRTFDVRRHAHMIAGGTAIVFATAHSIGPIPQTLPLAPI